MTLAANFVRGCDALTEWRDDVLSGTPPTLYPVGDGVLSGIEIGPGMVTLLGGAPGAGKTAFVMQCLFDALRLTEDLRAVVCNIEMPQGVLLDRQLARLSGVNLTDIRHRKLTAEHTDRIEAALEVIDSVVDRLTFVRPPFSLDNVAATADIVGCDLLVLDYIQRIRPPGEHGDRRGAVDATMNHLRAFADAGLAVVVLSAIGRTKDARGRSSYSGDGLSLASFRESSELEFGADDAFILTPDEETEGCVALRHLKSRNGQCQNIALKFDAALQRFGADFDWLDVIQQDNCAKTALRDAWGPARSRDGAGGAA